MEARVPDFVADEPVLGYAKSDPVFSAKDTIYAENSVPITMVTKTEMDGPAISKFMAPFLC